jgi:ribokinase
MKPRIAVIGSINMDMVLKSPRMPEPGENLFGKDFRMVPGGKGANQAVTAAKLGAHSIMMGRVGADVFGETLISNLKCCGVDTSFVVRDEQAATGIALIVVNDQGENSILIATGANENCCPADIDAVEKVLSGVDMVLLQLEIPMETIAYAVDTAHRHGVPVVLDAGPARKCPPELLSKVKILSPNESETKALTGMDVTDIETAERAAKLLLVSGPEIVVLKLGARGTLLAYGDKIHHIEGIEAPVVDTTAAGDVFTAALAVAYARGKSIEDAARYANCAGALAVTRFGAQSSTPTEAELDEFIERTESQNRD